jgi:hypothetical protein
MNNLDQHILLSATWRVYLQRVYLEFNDVHIAWALSRNRHHCAMQYYNQVLDAYLFESRIFSVCTLVVIAVVVVTHGVSYGRRPIVSISSPAALLGCCTSTNEAAVCCIRFATSKRKARTYIIMVRVVWKGFVILRPFSKLSSNASSDCEGLSTDDDLNRWCSVNILRFCSGFCAVLE